MKEILQREYGVELDVELVWEYAVQEMEHYSAEEIRVLEILLYSLEEVDEIQKQEMIDKLKTDCGVEVLWVDKCARRKKAKTIDKWEIKRFFDCGRACFTSRLFRLADFL